MRKFKDEGYYWVRYVGEWFIAEYGSLGFWVCGAVEPYPPTAFEEIGEEIPRKRNV